MTSKATFAAGCFWDVEAIFRGVDGVISTRVGFIGGTVDQPSYELVCTGTTGHAEAVEIIFDPEVVSYEALLDIFWASHDPTTLDRQGPDIGTQYRSAIFVHDEEQESAAHASKEARDASGHDRDPIVTEIAWAADFYQAEDDHQQYLDRRGRLR